MNRNRAIVGVLMVIGGIYALVSHDSEFALRLGAFTCGWMLFWLTGEEKKHG